MSLDFTSIVNGKQPVSTHSSQPNHIRISPPAEMNLINHSNINNGQQVHTRPSSSNSFDCEYPKPQQRMETREVVVKSVLMGLLKRISQGIAVQKSEVRFLINHLSENLELFAELDCDNQFFNFIQNEAEIAGAMLVFQLLYDPVTYQGNADILLNMEIDYQTLTAVCKFVQLCEMKSFQIPSDFLNKFISLCISKCERDSMHGQYDAGSSNRLLRMVCLFLDSLFSLRHYNPTIMRSEIQNFAITYLNLIREASQLYQKTLPL